AGAELDESRKVGAARAKLRANWVAVPVKSEEVWDLPLFRTTWRGKVIFAKVALRMGLAKLTGKLWVHGGAALQGRMFQKMLELGVDMRTNAGVERLETDERGRVTGVVATIDGKQTPIATRHGVLVNAGR